MYGQEKWVSETNPLKRWGYRLFGELHVPGRIRGNHVMRAISQLGLDSQPLRVLDAGSGRGDLAVALARRHPNWHIIGVDLALDRAAYAIAAAKHLGLKNLEFRIGDLANLGYENEFDLIVNSDVLEHIEDDRTVLRNLFRALRPGGHLVVTSPSIPQRRHLRLVRWRERRINFSVREYGHVRDGYGTRDIEDKFREAGGRVVSSYFTFGFFGTLAFDIFFVIGDNAPNPLVFTVMFPWLLGLGFLDLHFPSRVGSAILAVGTKGA